MEHQDHEDQEDNLDQVVHQETVGLLEDLEDEETKV